MAKIIKYGCEVAEAHRQYAQVHASMFGASSFRSTIDSLLGRGEKAYMDRQAQLLNLILSLRKIQDEISNCARDERTSRGSEQLQEVLCEYVDALISVIRKLSSICENLATQDRQYRELDSSGHSRFNQDKVEYEYAMSKLEYLGNKLNRLFSTY